MLDDMPVQETETVSIPVAAASPTHSIRKLAAVFAAAALIVGTSAQGQVAEPQKRLIDHAEYVRNGDTFTVRKYYLKETKSIIKEIRNSSGGLVSADERSHRENSTASAEILKILDDPTLSESSTVKVNISLPELDLPVNRPEASTGAMFDVGRGASFILGGKQASKAELSQDFNKRADKIKADRSIRLSARAVTVGQLFERGALDQQLVIDRYPADFPRTLTLELSKAELRKLLDKGAELVGVIELYKEPTDTISGAMINTKIDPDALDRVYEDTLGNRVGIYMTESGCANAGHITNYVRLTGPQTDHAENVSAIMRAVSPASWIYCRGGAAFPSTTDLNGYTSNHPVLIANRSNGISGSNSYSTLDRDWDNLVYDDSVLTFISAGNSGLSDDEIISPGKGYNVVTVGNYNDSTNTIHPTSSAKDPELDNRKPEVSAPGTSIAAGGHTLTGTSMSAPHAAAFSANLIDGLYSWLGFRPALTKSHVLAVSKRPISGGIDAVGIGGPDFRRAVASLDVGAVNPAPYPNDGTQGRYWQGPNTGSTFDDFDNQDSFPGSGGLESTIWLSSTHTNVRVVLTWLNRGDYTYTNRQSAFPIGLDLELLVLDPNGNLVALSASDYDSHEVVEFDPAVTGEYVIKVQRTIRRDTSQKLDAAYTLHWE